MSKNDRTTDLAISLIEDISKKVDDLEKKGSEHAVIELRIDNLEDGTKIIKKDIRANSEGIYKIELELKKYSIDMENMKKIVYGVVGLGAVYLIDQVLNLL